MLNNKRKSPTNTPKGKRRTIDETTVLDSNDSYEDDVPTTTPKVTFVNTPQVIPKSTNYHQEK